MKRRRANGRIGRCGQQAAGEPPRGSAHEVGARGPSLRSPGIQFLMCPLVNLPGMAVINSECIRWLALPNFERLQSSCP